MQEDDLHLSLGARVKMNLAFSDDLRLYPEVVDELEMEDMTMSIEIEFDPNEPQIFFFSTSKGLFKIDRQLQDPAPV